MHASAYEEGLRTTFGSSFSPLSMCPGYQTQVLRPVCQVSLSPEPSHQPYTALGFNLQKVKDTQVKCKV